MPCERRLRKMTKERGELKQKRFYDELDRECEEQKRPQQSQMKAMCRFHAGVRRTGESRVDDEDVAAPEKTDRLEGGSPAGTTRLWPPPSSQRTVVGGEP
mmetsp:Transcript_58344/g.190282  ORF Transcript_58344/g.190282 Transcript_58344/m.190282 type:complete len:100 (-) Transcript_58344:409-708(-)